MRTHHTDVVAEYLHEVDMRLAGLPVLQRRELLADLAAHIATERAERNLSGELELIEVLERLGSPEVVAAAAYAEAGPLPPPVAGPPMPPVDPPASRPLTSVPAMVLGVLALILAVFAAFVLTTAAARDSVEGPVVNPPVVSPVPEPTG